MLDCVSDKKLAEELYDMHEEIEEKTYVLKNLLHEVWTLSYDLLGLVELDSHERTCFACKFDALEKHISDLTSGDFGGKISAYINRIKEISDIVKKKVIPELKEKGQLIE